MNPPTPQTKSVDQNTLVYDFHRMFLGVPVTRSPWSVVPFLVRTLLCLASWMAIDTISVQAAVLRMAPYGLATGGDGLTWATAFTNVAELQTRAQPGDEVWFRGGTHKSPWLSVYLPENLELYGGFAGTETTRDDRAGSSTILDGTGLVLSGNSLVDGIQIHNAQNSRVTPDNPEYNEGAAVRGYGGNVRLLNCRFQGNFAGRRGGAGFFQDTTLVISNCVFATNWISGLDDIGRGSALAIVGGRTTISDSGFEGHKNNWSIIQADRGQIHLHRNRFEGYVAEQRYVLWATDVQGSVMENRFLSSKDSHYTTAILLGGSNQVDIANNLFLGAQRRRLNNYQDLPWNVVSTLSPVPPGEAGSIRLVNNTFASNNVPAVGADTPGLLIANNLVVGNVTGIVSTATGVVVRNNNVYGNSVDYAGIAAMTGINGNISADPQFLGDVSLGDARLSQNSPCRDAGDSASVLGETDLDGAPRVQGANPDIGATEIEPSNHIWRVAPPGLATGSDGLTWATAFTNVADLQTRAGSGDEVWLLGGTHKSFWPSVKLPPGLQLYGGFAGTESNRSERSGTATLISGTGFELQGETLLDGISIKEAANNRVSSEEARQMDGGALRGYGARVTIRNGRFEDNIAYRSGGAFYFQDSTLVVSNCTFGGNSVNPMIVGTGSSIAVDRCRATITECTFRDDRYPTTILELRESAIEFHRNLVSGFSKPQSVILEGFEVAGSVTGNRFLGSGDNSYSTAINFEYPSRVDIANNLFCGAKRHPTLPFVVSVRSLLNQGQVRFANNTVVSNANSAVYLEVPDILAANNLVVRNLDGIVISNATVAAFLNNNVYGNVANYLGVSDPTGTAGNLSTAPRFAGNPASGDARLQPNSPCHNTGDANSVIGPFDLDGQPRIQGIAPDIGATELTETKRVWYVSAQGGSSETSGGSWATAFTNLADVATAASPGDHVWLSAGEHRSSSATLTLPADLQLIGGFAGTESSVEERPGLETIIERTSLVITGKTLLDGITLRHGENSRATPPIPELNVGGGLRCYGGEVTLTGCKFVENLAGYAGGAGFFSNTSLVVSNCVFTNNFLVSILTAGSGTALAVQGGKAVVTDCLFTAERGGSLVSFFGTEVEFHRNRLENFPWNRLLVFEAANITGSMSSSRFLGSKTGTSYSSAVSLTGSNRFDISSCLFAGARLMPELTFNVLDLQGSGQIRVVNNTFVDNQVTAIDCSVPGTLFANNLIFRNATGIVARASGLLLTNNNVFANTLNYSGITDSTGTSGNLSVDPLLAGDAIEGVANLQPNSPCIDAGDALLILDTRDLDLGPRIQGPRPDIGASEFNATAMPLVLTIGRNPTELRWDATPGSPYQIQVSSNLVQWVVLGEVTPPTDPRTVSFPIQPVTSHAFYRVSR
ncbi:MAG: right-handed parallel beta-helix repeat-containing protein [Verrucomicrobiales bacterium]|nr:right-handed parallel beta-helix repeat-containing protein [Verrucomicrobiales bacterium]